MPRDVYEGVDVSSLIGSIQLSSIVGPAEGSRLSQLDPEPLTSYSLLPTVNGIETIIVPGSPPVWSPPGRLPVQLSGDRAQPAVLEAFPSCPLEPLFRALPLTAPEVDPGTFDIITDRRNLRLLFDFAGGRMANFRFDVEVVGESVLFSRWIDWESRRHSRGYGKGFEKRFTKTPACAAGSLVHKRAVAYTLGGVRMMVRFEVDACLHDPVEQQSHNGKDEEVVDMPTGHKMITKGVMTKPKGVVEMKTCTLRRFHDGSGVDNATVAQMWFSNTPILCQGIHDNGKFGRVVVTDLEETGTFGEWERHNGAKIAKMIEIIKLLRETTIKAEGGRFAVICENGPLQIRRLKSEYQFRLPQDIRAVWEQKQRERALVGATEKLAF